MNAATPKAIVTTDHIQGVHRADIGWAILKASTLNINARAFMAKAEIANRADDLFHALKSIVADSECYCADNVAAKGPCGYCCTKALLDDISADTH